jgi:hypothetical protein
MGRFLSLTVMGPSQGDSSFDMLTYLSSGSLTKITDVEITELMNSYVPLAVNAKQYGKQAVDDAKLNDDKLKKSINTLLNAIQRAYNALLSQRKTDIGKLGVRFNFLQLTDKSLHLPEDKMAILESLSTDARVQTLFYSAKHQKLCNELKDTVSMLFDITLRAGLIKMDGVKWRAIWKGIRKESPETAVISRCSRGDGCRKVNYPKYVGVILKHNNCSDVLGFDEYNNELKFYEGCDPLEDPWATGDHYDNYLMGCGKSNITETVIKHNTAYMDLSAKATGSISKANSYFGGHGMSMSRVQCDIFNEDRSSGYRQLVRDILDTTKDRRDIANPNKDGEWGPDTKKAEKEDPLNKVQMQMSGAYIYAFRGSPLFGIKLFSSGLLPELSAFNKYFEDYDMVFLASVEQHNGEFVAVLKHKHIDIENTFSECGPDSIWRLFLADDFRPTQTERLKTLIAYAKGKDYTTKMGDLQRVAMVSNCNASKSWMGLESQFYSNSVIGKKLVPFDYSYKNIERSDTNMPRLYADGDDVDFNVDYPVEGNADAEEEEEPEQIYEKMEEEDDIDI